MIISAIGIFSTGLAQSFFGKENKNKPQLNWILWIVHVNLPHLDNRDLIVDHFHLIALNQEHIDFEVRLDYVYSEQLQNDIKSILFVIEQMLYNENEFFKNKPVST